jgi:hypothetical protein
MKKIVIFAFAALMLGTGTMTAMRRKQTSNPRQAYKVYVDKEGVMRRDDTKEEVSYYGTNYTLPFAYSYRATQRLGKDQKYAIERDVYHMARLGFNAFRLHLWDAELADSAGNLLDNDHLDLLDYLISQLEFRGIDIILTAQTNFGNGYPEKNIDTGSFTYDFDKCRIHDDPAAQEIQVRYLTQLAQHENRYTGRSYADDNAIIAMEINNEPCHSGSKKEVTAYINKMAKTLRTAGFDKPILYNVTHNPDVTSAYYDADINGTTYQWYPIGLVSNHERKGNFLPMLDEYTIPWKKSMKNYNKLARVVYEFDPADVLYSYLYPAVARTFRKEGFQWITQFAYDPTDIAQYNTEYPTHYMNLIYTPAKALSMMVAVETAKETPRGADYGSYPENQKFGHTRVSYEEDLSEFNSEKKFIYSNSTATTPLQPDSLKQIAGHGNSPLVSYTGTGAYFLDRLDENHWRLEVMPDVTVISDPFHDTSIDDTKVSISKGEQTFSLALPGLGSSFQYMGVNEDNSVEGSTDNGSITVEPGAYLLLPLGERLPDRSRMGRGMATDNIRLLEYYDVVQDRTPVTLLAAESNDKNLDMCQIPDGWNFRLERQNPNWDEPTFYQLTVNPEKDGNFVMRRYVADKTSRIPATAEISNLKMRIYNDVAGYEGSALPAGTEIAVVGKDGATYGATLAFGADGVATVPFTALQPREGVIAPAPYPVMCTRSIATRGTAITAAQDIEFVELIIPQKSGESATYLIDRIWVE